MSSGIETIEKQRRTYLPAAGHDWLLPLYDPFLKVCGGEPARKALADQADIRPGHHILDIGCGTGTFAVMIKRLHPDVNVVGLDPDPKALARARRKAEQASVSIKFDQGYSDQLPHPDGSFDRVFSSLMFHHLKDQEKEKTLREVVRVLKSDGSFQMLDFTESGSGAHGLLPRLLHFSHRLKDNSENRILALMSNAGFVSAEKVRDSSMLFGLLRTAYYQASV